MLCGNIYCVGLTHRIMVGATHQRADLFGKDYVDNAAKQCVARVQGPPPRRKLTVH